MRTNRLTDGGKTKAAAPEAHAAKGRTALTQDYFCHVSFTRFVLNDDQRRLFEQLSIYCDHYAELIPVSFVLGEFLNPARPGPPVPLQSTATEASFSISRFLRDPGGVPLVGPV